MFSRIQFARIVTALSLFLLSCASFVRAQDAPAGMVGRVEGNDVSVDSGTPASLGTATAAPSMFVANGGVVTVHSGQARMTLSEGGQLDICGPAKLTVLESGGAITIALNFGRVHIELPAGISLRIFTPSIIATPIGIGGAPRDFSVGLNLDDSLCVLATGGALQLEHQFSGQKLIVPQTGEFFLASGQLVPVAGAAGSCECAEMQTRAPIPQPPPLLQPAPSSAMLTAPVNAANNASAAAASGVQPTQPGAPEPGVSHSVLGHANESHPVTAAPNNPVPDAPAVAVPAYTAVSPLTFSAADPHPPDPNPDIVLLVREARAEPDWEFSGRVEAPDFATSMQRALGVTPATPQPASQTASPAANEAPAKQKKKGGFWAGLKSIFVGSGPD